MRVSVYLPLLLCAAVALASRPVSSRMAPGRAAVGLALASVAAASASTWGLVLLAATLIADTGPVVERAADRGVHLSEPVPAVVAVMALAALTVALLRVARVVGRRRVVRQHLRNVCSAHGSHGELVVLSVEAPHAVAVPKRLGRAGHILVTTGMLRLLDGPQRRAVLAHERAHLHGRHGLLRAAVQVSAALNPLLCITREVVNFLTERAADEKAASEAGRSALAQALSKVALWVGPVAPGGGVMAFHDLAVSRRVAALHQPALPDPHPFVVGIVSLGLVALLPAGDATVAFVRLIGELSPS